MKKIARKKQTKFKRHTNKGLPVLSRNQIERITSCTEIAQYDRDIFVILLNTGLRVAELTDLNYADVYDLENNRVKDEARIIGKGQKIATIFLKLSPFLFVLKLALRIK